MIVSILLAKCFNHEVYSDVAGEAGFEPTHDGVKVRCLTAWLLPTESPTKGYLKKWGGISESN